MKQTRNVSELFFPLPQGSMHPAEHSAVETLRMCFEAVPSHDKNGKLDVGYRLNTKKLQIDLSKLDLEDIRFDKAAADCGLLKSAISQHPQKLREAAAVLLSGKPLSREELDHVFKILSSVNLTEDTAAAHGGGLVWLVVVAVVLIIAIAARSCNPNDHDVHGNEDDDDDDDDDEAE